MRKEWMEPVIKVQEFVANEYVAACESGKVYKFECNAPAGDLYYYPKSDGKIDGIYNGSGRAILLGSYHPCGPKHDASATSVFYDGFIDYDGNGYWFCRIRGVCRIQYRQHGARARRNRSRLLMECTTRCGEVVNGFPYVAGTPGIIYRIITFHSGILEKKLI